MPQGLDRLRQKFLIYNELTASFDDGIEKCENIIANYGGFCRRGYIYLPDIQLEDITDELHDAVQYLIEEWDYAFA